MKKKTSDMQAEYDFSNAVQGKYARRYARGTNMVLLDPDVAKIFGDSDSVNKALRLFAKMKNRTSGRTKRRTRLSKT
jgi:hypothetical protein